MPSAIAADVVVLPTPPAPAQMQISLPSSSRSSSQPRAPAPRASALERAEVELRLEQEGERTTGARPSAAAQARELLALARAARWCSDSAARSAARTPGDPFELTACSMRVRLAVGEALRVERVHHHARRAPCPARRAARASRSSVSLHRHLLGQRDGDHAGELGVADEARRSLAPGGGSARRRRRRGRSAARAASPSPWPVTGASTITRS